MKKIKYSEITPEKIYLKRRDFIKKLGLSTSSLMIGQNFLNFAGSTDQVQANILKQMTLSNSPSNTKTSK